jgi:ketosteroid isomerase-like protein
MGLSSIGGRAGALHEPGNGLATLPPIGSLPYRSQRRREEEEAMNKVTCLASVALAVGVALLVPGCATMGSAEVAAQTEIVRQGIVDRAAMFNRGQVQGLVDAWDENGVNMPPGQSPTIGKENLAKVTRAPFERFNFANRVHNVQEVRVVSPDWAFAWGYYNYERTPKEGGPTTRYYGKFSVILRRQPDGSWKKYIDCYNDEPMPK